MTITLSMGSNTVRSYDEILEFFGRVGYDENSKFVMIPDYNANQTGCRNFWRMYKKKANATVQEEWDLMFGTGRPWKNPSNGNWRFYFNFPEPEPILEPEVNEIVEEMEVVINSMNQDADRKEEAVREGFAFTEEQLQAIRNL